MANQTLATLAAMLGGGYTGYADTLKRRTAEGAEAARQRNALDEIGIQRTDAENRRQFQGAQVDAWGKDRASSEEQARLDREARAQSDALSAQTQRETAGTATRMQLDADRQEQEQIGAGFLARYGQHPVFSQTLQALRQANRGMSENRAAYLAGQRLMPGFRSPEDFFRFMQLEDPPAGGAPDQTPDGLPAGAGASRARARPPASLQDRMNLAYDIGAHARGYGPDDDIPPEVDAELDAEVKRKFAAEMQDISKQMAPAMSRSNYLKNSGGR